MELRPSAFELLVQDDNDQTIDELVKVVRERCDNEAWLAQVVSVDDEGGEYDAVVAPGDSPATALKQLAKVLRLVADRVDPLTGPMNAMMLGLVRAAEFKEQHDGGKIWDDESRIALEIARELGWGAAKTGTLGR